MNQKINQLQMKIDNKRYFELLNEAANSPNCIGVCIIKRRRMCTEAANMNYASLILKRGRKVSVLAKEENQEYVERWLGVMKNYYGLNVECRKLYSSEFMEEGAFENKDNFIGYQFFCLKEDKRGVKKQVIDLRPKNSVRP